MSDANTASGDELSISDKIVQCNGSRETEISQTERVCLPLSPCRRKPAHLSVTVTRERPIDRDMVKRKKNNSKKTEHQQHETQHQAAMNNQLMKDLLRETRLAGVTAVSGGGVGE